MGESEGKAKGEDKGEAEGKAEGKGEGKGVSMYVDTLSTLGPHSSPNTPNTMYS